MNKARSRFELRTIGSPGCIENDQKDDEKHEEEQQLTPTFHEFSKIGNVQLLGFTNWQSQHLGRCLQPLATVGVRPGFGTPLGTSRNSPRMRKVRVFEIGCIKKS